jgi:ribosomal-protein-alanine N-acetyltransferase
MRDRIGMLGAMDASQYFLCSERIGFRQWSQDDFVLAKGLWGDPEVTRLFSKLPLSDQQIQARLDSEIDQEKIYGVQYWPMFELATHHHIGCGGLRPYKVDENIYEIGFHLRPQYWGKGFATEAGRTISAYAIDQLGIAALFAGHHPENIGSQKTLRKLGFEEIGAQFYEPTGLLHASYMFRRNSTTA